MRVYAADVIKTAFRLKADQSKRPKVRLFILTHYDKVFSPKLRRFVRFRQMARHAHLPAGLACDLIQQNMRLKSKELLVESKNLEPSSTGYKEKLDKLTENRERQKTKLQEIMEEIENIEVEFLSLVNYLGSSETLI